MNRGSNNVPSPGLEHTATVSPLYREQNVLTSRPHGRKVALKLSDLSEDRADLDRKRAEQNIMMLDIGG